MRDDSSLRRQWDLLRALSARRLGLSAREMAAELGVCDRTVRRDLALFRRVGFPLEEAVGAFGTKTWRIAPAGLQPPLSFTFTRPPLCTSAVACLTRWSKAPR